MRSLWGPTTDEKIILKRILNKWDMRGCEKNSFLLECLAADCCGHVNET
jgi:hypothetical protein